ncbi:hypothetical protein HPB50_003076 [Hyalomma asiaticum]|uniref:Uncharacterized protein n=1 Tax=Hyalomma asiaticum TaxID=266040 RepID=A0ACB7SUC0_HYAAI|nr:hypothetical protein HPB50_003076 [Hyalomma asiaticum]
MDITDAFSDTNQRSNFPPETPPACDRGVQVDSRQAVASLLTTEKAKWKRKERDLRNQVSRLQRTVDKYKLELEKLQQDSMVADISYIKERAVEQQPAALFLLDQIINFRRKRPTWSEETTRRFNSDPIESLFGTLRMSSGTNDMLDVRAALSGLEKILKTGIPAANVTSNVAHAESVTSSPLPGSASSSQPVCTSSALVSSAANTDVQTPPSLKKAVVVLQRLTTSVLPQYLPSLQISATVYVGGYIARVVSEKVNCENCVSLCTKPVTNQPLLQLTRNQDRGGLLYPSDQLLFILDTLRAFADSALRDNPTLQKPLSSLTKCTVPALCASRFLKCQSDGSCDHRARLMNLVSVHFLRPLLSNYAFNVTDKQDACQYVKLA